ncbi:MAG: helix-turn-helix domain-containing protein [Mangrovibacterium sp.]
MLVFNFSRVLKIRGIDKSFNYFTKHGFSANFACRIKNNQGREINLKHLESLCLLLRCTPNDLLEWRPDATMADAGEHPLKALIRKNEMQKLNALLAILPLDKLEQVDAYIRNEIQNT